MSDMDQYSRYFPIGMKVGVGIPLPNADVFRDWAIIHHIEEDLVSLQLSRDVLPVNVSLHYGLILELRGGSDNAGYCCRAIVVSEGDSRELLLRMIGEIVSDELREFYRIDAFLPIKYIVSREQNVDRLHEQWEARWLHRQQLEYVKKDHPWVAIVPPEDDETKNTEPPEDAEPPDEAEQLEGPLSNQSEQAAGDETVPDQSAAETAEPDPWDSIIPLAANISGGGLRVVTHHGFEYGEYVLLEILVPLPRRVVDAVGRVVFANRNYAAGSDHEYFNLGIQFVHINERDRDAIINYISTIQLQRIRQLRERYLYRGIDAGSDLGASSFYGIRKSVFFFAVILFLAIVAILVNYFRQYAYQHPKGEIQKTFEEGVKKYRENNPFWQKQPF